MKVTMYADQDGTISRECLGTAFSLKINSPYLKNIERPSSSLPTRASAQVHHGAGREVSDVVQGNLGGLKDLLNFLDF